MRLREFQSYEEYVEAQRGSDKHKSDRAGCATSQPHEIERIVQYLLKDRFGIRSMVGSILCHGVNIGVEIDLFKQFLPWTKVLGTDLFPREREDIKVCDFADVNEEWIGKWDAVYSNSLDHARDPVNCIRVWLDQLKPNGLLFVTWTAWHAGRVMGGDCFSARLDEYVHMMNRITNVRDLIYGGRLGRRGHYLATVVVEK